MVEYSSMSYAMFFLGEYANMVLMSGMTSILFLGGWMSPLPFAPFTWIPGPIWFILKICLMMFMFFWVRATFPALPLRPAHAAGLEGVPATVARLDGADGLCAGTVRLAAQWLTTTA